VAADARAAAFRSGHATGGSETVRAPTGEDRMIDVVGVPQRPSAAMTASR